MGRLTRSSDEGKLTGSGLTGAEDEPARVLTDRESEPPLTDLCVLGGREPEAARLGLLLPPRVDELDPDAAGRGTFSLGAGTATRLVAVEVAAGTRCDDRRVDAVEAGAVEAAEGGLVVVVVVV